MGHTNGISLTWSDLDCTKRTSQRFASGFAIVFTSQTRRGQRDGCCRAFPPLASSLPICAAEHQRLGPNPRGSPNPGDYPASFPPLPSPRRSIVLHSDLVFVTLGDKWDEWMPWTRQGCPQVHWVILSSFTVVVFFPISVNMHRV